MFIIGIVLGVKEVMSNPEKYNSKKDIQTIFNATEFSRVSIDELKTKLGDPSNIENWNNETSKGTFPMQIYTYNQDNDYYEFIIYENTVVKVQCFGKWKYDKKKDDIFTMFGIEPTKRIKKIICL